MPQARQLHHRLAVLALPYISSCVPSKQRCCPSTTSSKRRRPSATTTGASSKPNGHADGEIYAYGSAGGGRERKPRRDLLTHDVQGIPASARVIDESIPPFEKYSLFASCLPGLEPLLHIELVKLGLEPDVSLAPVSKRKQRRESKLRKDKDIGKDTEQSSSSSHAISASAQAHSGAGGISFTVNSVESILRCHLHLGTATHILLRCGKPFKARGMEELRRKVSKMVFWKQYLHGYNGARNDGFNLPNLDIRVSASKSRLYHTEAIAERVKKGILGALGLDSDGLNDNWDSEERDRQRRLVKLVVRVKNDYVQISIDTSNTPLHRRGYRLEGAKSPLREDLAYALLYGSGWRSTNNNDADEFPRLTHLLDPCCGSGTIPIEGAAIAAGMPPGRLRPAPLTGSSLANESLWKRLISHSESCTCDVGVYAFGSDRNRGAIAASKANAERAGLADLIAFKNCAIKATPWLCDSEAADASLPDRLLIATNPPFGIRSSQSKDVYPLYRTLTERFNSLRSDASLSVLVHDISVMRKASAGLQSNVLFSTRHGGLSVVAMKYSK